MLINKLYIHTNSLAMELSVSCYSSFTNKVFWILDSGVLLVPIIMDICKLPRSEVNHTNEVIYHTVCFDFSALNSINKEQLCFIQVTFICNDKFCLFFHSLDFRTVTPCLYPINYRLFRFYHVENDENTLLGFSETIKERSD